MPAELMSRNYQFLTGDIMRSWLGTGVPTREEMRDRYCCGTDDIYGRGSMNHGMMMGAYEARHKTIPEIGFAVPCREVIDMLAQSGPLLEVGAGTGFWAALISRAGGDIIATDSYEGDQYGFTFGQYHPVHEMEAQEAVRTHPGRDVLSVWSSFDEPWMTAATHLINTKLHLVSEGAGGCVADDSLFELLDREFNEVSWQPIPQWFGLRDRFQTFERKSILIDAI